MKRAVRSPLFTAACIAIAAAQPAPAEEKLIDAEQCLYTRSIDRTRIVDNQNVLFYMRNGDVYLNKLPRECPGLALEDTFMYRTSTSQLCRADVITVLQNIGFGFQPGVSCGLGMFRVIDEPTAEELLRKDG